ncbi:phosphotransferase [Microlunatus sp. Gsoil 973]|nr:phosphotransferase [Microlunatus sp. Gsoil 973]
MSEESVDGRIRQGTPAPLAGGVMSAATKVGQTVRRSASPSWPAVHALLTHLRRTGFTQVPEPMGVDENGREILSFIDGRAGHPPITPEIASDDALRAAATAIRDFHDATVGFSAHGWSTNAADPLGPAEVICHNDLAPFNLIYRGRSIAAIIDWDGAAPGRRVWDLAYAAWRLVPLHRPEYASPLGWPDLDRSARLAAFADAYRMSAEIRHDLIDTIRERQTQTVSAMAELAKQGTIRALPESDPRAESGDIRYFDLHEAAWNKAVNP